VILIIALIALVVLMIGGVALVHSFDTTLLQAGNLAFKRDLSNQSERGMTQALAVLATGTLADEAIRRQNAPSKNYSAKILESDAFGIPKVLISPEAYTAAAFTLPDIDDGKVSIRYVIDRQCSNEGLFDPVTCRAVTSLQSDKGGSDRLKKSGAGSRPIYRITVRVNGPRHTQAYLQTTVTL
jgi:hypothetical protein